MLQRAPEGLVEAFSAVGLRSFVVKTLREALGILRQWRFDAVLFDDEGFAERSTHILSQIQQCGKVPIVLITAPCSNPAQLEHLASGATELVFRPFLPELAALKVRRLAEFRRHRPLAGASELVLGPLVLDVRRAVATIDGVSLGLRSRQFELLLLLASRPGQSVHRQAIAAALSASGSGEGRSIDMAVSRIRLKLREFADGQLEINTVIGRGYSLALVQDASVGEAGPPWSA